MRFVIHCTLLLLAFVGFVTIIDHGSGPGQDVDLADLGVRQLDASDEAAVALRQGQAARNALPIRPLLVTAMCLACVAIYGPGNLGRRWKRALAKHVPARKGTVV